ncbi:hypothetical protein EVAR_99133_1 [Eumeta japonica]|uniref:Uncharacterized protein n=1 Tax=Eumeta variegata TaxID=151549 RepID=A0A4C1YRQ6_EUMVA|nr:hypothetical protein EVAR_99133_1 [Eumeta japonica]
MTIRAGNPTSLLEINTTCKGHAPVALPAPPASPRDPDPSRRPSVTFHNAIARRRRLHADRSHCRDIARASEGFHWERVHTYSCARAHEHMYTN